jgi:ParB family chromosome partitioning protein
MQPTLIAASKLERSPRNARRTVTKDGLAELKASILAHGLMQNLVVTAEPDGCYRVIAGGRRLEAIQSLIAEGRLPEDFAVPCRVASGEHALEMSLAENVVRLSMHPADQYEAFAALIDEGKSATEVAERFGVDESLVVKRMKLARVAPALLEAYREDGLTLECLMAFTVTDDHERQLAVYESLGGWQKDDPAHIRACLTEQMENAGSKLARFVGLDAYKAAGGASRTDLFGDAVYLESPALLRQLADAKLAVLRKELEAEGWGWVEIDPERNWEFISRCSRIQPRLIGAPAELVAEYEEAQARAAAVMEDDGENDEGGTATLKADARVDELEERLSAFIGFDAKERALAGCCLSIAQDGTPFVDKGLVRPEHKKLVAAMLGGDAGKAAAAKARPKDRLPEALRRDLAGYRQQAAQAELAKHPEIAFDLLAFEVAQASFDKRFAAGQLDVELKAQLPKPGGTTGDGSPLAGIAKALRLSWLKPRTQAGRFEAFRRLDYAEKLRLLAYCVATTLKPSLAPESTDEATACDVSLALTGADMADYWRPTGENFLGRVNREQLLAIGRDTLGSTWSHAAAKDKKSSLVDQLERAFAEPGKPGRTPEQADKLKRWLPAGMAFATPGATAVRAKKARKAA